MFGRGVVWHKVNNDSDAKTLRLSQQGVKVFVGAKKRINQFVVGYIVASIFLRGFEKRRKPNRIYAQSR
jgi:hypothetical protein